MVILLPFLQYHHCFQQLQTIASFLLSVFQYYFTNIILFLCI
jgi:hypothetical protein